MITANTETITEITSTTEATTTLELQVINPNLANINLSLITINIYSGVIGTLNYTYNSENLTARVDSCSEDAEIMIIPETVEYNGQTYTVTSINGSSTPPLTTPFPISSLQVVIMPKTVTFVGWCPFYNSGLTVAYFAVPEGWAYSAYTASFSNPTTAADLLKNTGSSYYYGFNRS